MLKVHVVFHQDGDFLTIVEVPWWLDIYEWLANRLCPCCGLTGWISGRSEKAELLFFRIWNKALGLTLKYEKRLYKTPVDGCIASKAIFKNEGACWREDCEHCWHLREDAFDSSV